MEAAVCFNRDMRRKQPVELWPSRRLSRLRSPAGELISSVSLVFWERPTNLAGFLGDDDDTELRLDCSFGVRVDGRDVLQTVQVESFPADSGVHSDAGDPRWATAGAQAEVS